MSSASEGLESRTRSRTRRRVRGPDIAEFALDLAAAFVLMLPVSLNPCGRVEAWSDGEFYLWLGLWMSELLQQGHWPLVVTDVVAPQRYLTRPERTNSGSLTPPIVLACLAVTGVQLPSFRIGSGSTSVAGPRRPTGGHRTR